MSDFLPKGYDEAEKKEKEKSSAKGYMKFVEGDNRYRILMKPITGWVWWIDKAGDVVEKGSKPVKGNTPVRINMETDMGVEQFENAKLFWAMQVWNYAEEKAQILELTQITIRKDIGNYIKDKDWGNPTKYDLITERIEEDRVSYSTRAKPHTKFVKKGKTIPPINLDALYLGEDPYEYEVEADDIDIDELLDEVGK